MIVYRVIRYEGSAIEIQKTLDRSINGRFTVPIGVEIIASAIEPRIIEGVPMIGHALLEAGKREWRFEPPKPPVARSPLAAMSGGSNGACGLASTNESVAFISRIDDLLSNGCDWASETLLGIQQTVERTGVVSEGQRRAVDNIEHARRRD